MQKRVKKRILPLVLALMLVAFISEAQVFAAVDITTFKAGLLAPRGMTVDDDGNVYVVELDRNQINKFDSDGTLLKTWGGEGSGDGKFKSPYGIALDSSGNIYVTDTGNKRIQKFDFNGDFITKWSGGADYYFESPAAIAVDSDNKVYVADCFSKLIQKFDSDGGFIKSWGGVGEDEGKFKNPIGLALDSDNNIYVADSHNYRIQKFDSDGDFIKSWKSYGNGDNQFYSPTEIAVDLNGNIYISDSGNNRIQVLRDSTPTPAEITTASVAGITAPVAGAAPVASGSLTAGDASCTVTSLTWQNSDGSAAALTTEGKFKAASTYRAVIELTAAAGYKFQALTPTVNAGTAEAGTFDADGEGNKLTFTVTFDPTAALQVTGIAVTTQPNKLSYTEGTDGILALNGMVVTETNNDGSAATVTFIDGTAAGYTTGPANGTALTNAAHNNFAVTVTHTASGLTAQTGNLAVNTAPPATHPGAPTIQSAIAGNRQVTIGWSGVPGSTGYNVYSSTTSNTYTTPSATVTGAVYSSDVTGLTNGTAYYFVVTAVGPDGESAFSNEVSATPRTVPGAPANITATAGNGQAAVSFTPPADNGGSAITGYTVTSSPGNITATGTGTNITLTGLSNGTAYTFTVTASNVAGTGPASEASNAVTPYRPSSGDSDRDETPPIPVTPSQPTNGVDILVNGKTVTVATVTTTKVDNKTVATVVVDDKKLVKKLQQEGNNAVVTIPVKNHADVVIGTLNGQTVKNMENTESVLEIITGSVTYTLPASQINIDTVSEQMGKQLELKDIAVSVKISEPEADTVKIVEDTADKNNYQIMVKPIEFEITCSNGEKTVEVSKFNAYVERLIEIPEGIDPSKITTGIILNADGTFSHVPTAIIVIDGKYYAKINSLTNSTYSVIWSPKTFKDVEKHWAKDAVNNMGSRLVISGVRNDMFEPDRDITRGEFAAIVVRALGLMRPGTGKASFNDIAKNDWYYDAVSIAYENDIISGYGNGKFGPDDKITREQAMTMIARAMKITGLKVEIKDSEVSSLLANYTDGAAASAYAKTSIAACLKTGVITGRIGSTIAPRDYITRAEVAVIVQRLLQKSNLI